MSDFLFGFDKDGAEKIRYNLYHELNNIEALPLVERDWETERFYPSRAGRCPLSSEAYYLQRTTSGTTREKIVITKANRRYKPGTVKAYRYSGSSLGSYVIDVEELDTAEPDKTWAVYITYYVPPGGRIRFYFSFTENNFIVRSNSSENEGQTTTEKFTITSAGYDPYVLGSVECVMVNGNGAITEIEEAGQEEEGKGFVIYVTYYIAPESTITFYFTFKQENFASFIGSYNYSVTNPVSDGSNIYLSGVLTKGYEDTVLESGAFMIVLSFDSNCNLSEKVYYQKINEFRERVEDINYGYRWQWGESGHKVYGYIPGIVINQPIIRGDIVSFAFSYGIVYEYGSYSDSNPYTQIINFNVKTNTFQNKKIENAALENTPESGMGLVESNLSANDAGFILGNLGGQDGGYGLYAYDNNLNELWKTCIGERLKCVTYKNETSQNEYIFCYGLDVNWEWKFRCYQITGTEPQMLWEESRYLGDFSVYASDAGNPVVISVDEINITSFCYEDASLALNWTFEHGKYCQAKIVTDAGNNIFLIFRNTGVMKLKPDGTQEFDISDCRGKEGAIGSMLFITGDEGLSAIK